MIPSISSEKEGLESQKQGFHFRERFIDNREHPSGYQPSIEHVPCLLGQECAVVIPSVSSEKEGLESRKQGFHFRERFIAATENAPMIRTPPPSAEDVPRVLRQGRALVTLRTYSKKDEWKSQKIHTPSSEDAPPLLERDAHAGIPRGTYKYGLRWGGW